MTQQETQASSMSLNPVPSTRYSMAAAESCRIVQTRSVPTTAGRVSYVFAMA